MNEEYLDQVLEKSLSSDPGFILPADFASKVTQTIVRREQWKVDFREYLLYSGVTLGLIALVSGFYFFIDQNNVTQAVSFLKEHWISVAIILLLLNFIFFTDKVLLRLLFIRWNEPERIVFRNRSQHTELLQNNS